MLNASSKVTIEEATRVPRYYIIFIFYIWSLILKSKKFFFQNFRHSLSSGLIIPSTHSSIRVMSAGFIKNSSTWQIRDKNPNIISLLSSSWPKHIATTPQSLPSSSHSCRPHTSNLKSTQSKSNTRVQEHGLNNGHISSHGVKFDSKMYYNRWRNHHINLWAAQVIQVNI